MRNASKNTIKKVLRNAASHKQMGLYFDKRAGENAYFLFNEVGAQIWRMSKGRICNRAFTMTEKYRQYLAFINNRN